MVCGIVYIYSYSSILLLIYIYSGILYIYMIYDNIVYIPLILLMTILMSWYVIGIYSSNGIYILSYCYIMNNLYI